MERLLCGAVYSPDPARLGRDTALMARAGFNLVTAALPAGEGAALLRRTLAAAGKAGLRVLVELRACPEERELRRLLPLAAGSGCVAGLRLPRGAEEARRIAAEAMGPERLLPPAPELPESGESADIAFYAALARSESGDGYIGGVPLCGAGGALLSPGRARLAALTHIASGAAGVEFARWRSGDGSDGSYAPGVLGYDLRPGALYGECAAAASELARLSDKLAGLRKENRVALLLSARSETLFDLLHGAGSYRSQVRAVADSLHRLNAEYDLLRDGAADLSPYRLLAAPALCAASEGLLEALDRYVAGGGRLIASGRMGFAGEDLRARSNLRVLTGLLGAASPGLVDARGAPLRSRRVQLPEGSRLEGLMELLVPGTASVLAAALHPERGELPAVTVNVRGRGQAAYIAAPLPPEVMDEVLDHLLRAFRVPLPGIRSPLVLRRARSREGRDLIFFLNHSPVPQPLPYGGELPPWGAQVRENGAPL